MQRWGWGWGGSEVTVGFKWRVWGLAQGCRQARKWEFGITGGKARRAATNF